MANALDQATNKANLAVKADKEGRFDEAERYYKEASQDLIEYCKDDSDKLSQMATHISNYLDRVTHLENRRKNLSSEESAQLNGPEVDKQAQQQAEDFGLTSAQAQDALRRFDNNVERAIAWHFENVQAEPESSTPPMKPSSIPSASTKPSSSNPFAPSNMNNNLNNKQNTPSRARRSLSPARVSAPDNSSSAACPEFRKFNPPPSPVARPPARPPRGASPPRQVPTLQAPPALPPRTSQPAQQQSQNRLQDLMGLLQEAAVSDVATCRCVMFSNELGAKCGMPAALVAGEGASAIAGDLCWSCKYMEAVSGQDALISLEDAQTALEGDDDEEESELHQAKAQASEQNQVESSLSNQTASIVLPVPAPPVKDDKPRGWFDGWFGGSSGETHEALSNREREELEGEFVKLKSLKNNNGLTDAQKKKFRLIRRSLRTNEVIEIENANHLVVTSPTSRRKSLTSPIDPPPPKVESEDEKIRRLKQVLREARVSETAKCKCDLYSMKPGEVCSRPAALSFNPNTQQTTPSTMCWQCKRIDAYSM